MKKQLAVFAAGAVFIAAAQSSFAGSFVATPALNYSITLTGDCTAAVTTGSVNFGTYGATAGNQTDLTAGTVYVTCANTMPYAICLNGGTYPSGGTRNLAKGADRLAYKLRYLGTEIGDTGCAAYISGYTASATWANPIGGMPLGSVTGNGGIQQYDLKAEVIIPPTAIPGTYTDPAVAVTVVW